MKTKAIIFDLYGTLIQADNVSWDLYSPIMKMTGMSGRELRHHLLTEDYSCTGELLLKFLINDHDEFLRLINDLALVVHSARFYEETEKVLTDLKALGIKLGLISNMSSAYKKPFFKLGLDSYIDRWIFSCEAGVKKPDQSIFDSMVDLLGVEKDEIIMVGDSFASDYQGAKNAGLKALLLDRENKSDIKERISNLNEISEYV